MTHERSKLSRYLGMGPIYIGVFMNGISTTLPTVKAANAFLRPAIKSGSLGGIQSGLAAIGMPLSSVAMWCFQHFIPPRQFTVSHIYYIYLPSSFNGLLGQVRSLA